MGNQKMDFFINLGLSKEGITLLNQSPSTSIPFLTRGSSAIRTRAVIKRRVASYFEFTDIIKGISLKIQAFYKMFNGLALCGEANRGKEKFCVQFKAKSGEVLGRHAVEIPPNVSQIEVEIVQYKDTTNSQRLSCGIVNWDQDEKLKLIDKVALIEQEWLKYQTYLENKPSWDDLGWEKVVDEFVYSTDSPMELLIRLLKVLAATDFKILLIGESGTGKELLAKFIWKNSERNDKGYQAVNCGQFEQGTANSELFGHKKGAFTSAHQNKTGLFEKYNNGTLFLDEIADLPSDVQSNLLRAIDNGEIRRVGENETRKVNVRIIAATNKDLKTEIENGNFREDLYNRLTKHTSPLRTIPLRLRLKDITVLIVHTAEKFCQNKGIKFKPLTESLFKAALWYEWPRNVRQIEGFVESSLIHAQNKKIDFHDIKDPEVNNELNNAFQEYNKAYKLWKKEEKSEKIKEKTEEDLIDEWEENIIAQLTKIAANLFEQSTEIWNLAKKRHTLRSVKSYDRRYSLNPAEKNKIERKISNAQDEVKKILFEQEYHVQSDLNCYNLLIKWFHGRAQKTEISTRDLKKQVLKILKSVYKKLKEKKDIRFDFSSKVEERDYYTFEKFFGTKYDQLRK